MMVQMQDVTDRERDADSETYSAGPAAGASYSQSEGYSVRGAPWSNAAPDTNSRDDFPDLAQVLHTASATLLGQKVKGQGHGGIKLETALSGLVNMMP